MDIVIRASVIFFLLWLITRALGKRELSEITAFELVLLVTVGDLVQQGATQEDMSLTGAVLAVGTIAMWVLVFSLISWRWRPARTVLEGMPVLVVHHGRILLDHLKTERVTAEEVKESARAQGIASLEEVGWGVLEPDGRFSFIREDANATPRDQPVIVGAQRRRPR